MSVYIVAQVNVQDRAEYEEYVARFRKMFVGYKGEVLAVDNDPKVLEGEWPTERTALLRFDDEGEALRWYHSTEYQAAAQHRRRGATTNMVLIKGKS